MRRPGTTCAVAQYLNPEGGALSRLGPFNADAIKEKLSGSVLVPSDKIDVYHSGQQTRRLASLCPFALRKPGESGALAKNLMRRSRKEQGGSAP